MLGQLAHMEPRSRFWSPVAMRDELYHAVVEALYELDMLPEQGDGAVLGLYAVMDDLTDAIRRTQALDPWRPRPLTSAQPAQRRRNGSR
jgi:hypothetical protein